MNRVLKVTVAICTYNRAALLRQTLERVCAVDYPAGALEVVVVDNNSPDDTRAVVDSFATADHAPRYVHESRQGLSHARNRALEEASGEIILFGDDDILVDPDWVRAMAAPFEGDAPAGIGCVGGEVIPVFPNGRPDWIREWHQPLAFRPEAGPLTARQGPMGANLAFRRSVIERVGSFDSKLARRAGSFFGGEDTEMVRRIRAAGFEVWFAPQAKVLHQMPASRTTFRYAARHGFDSARSRVVDRTQQGGAVGYLLSRVPANIVKALVFSLLALLSVLVLQSGAAKKWLVRAWRSCGFLFQIPRSLCGKV